jgi:Asparagine synthase
MGYLRIDIANPDARVRKTMDGFLCFCTSDPEGRPVDDLPLERAWSLAVNELDDGALIGVTLDDGKPTEVRAFRAPASSYELYFVRTDSGVLFLTDQFACALAVVPPGHREVSPESLADHLLFRTVPGAQTYIRAVERVGHGEEIVWRHRPLEVFQRVRCPLDAGDALRVEEFPEVLDSVLGEIISPLASLDGIENMLSGGVDSTLVHTYLGPSIPSVSAALTSDEFKFEVDYALEASKLLGTRHRLVRFEEDAYFAELESCVDGIGMPPHHLQTVLLDTVFRSPGRRFITAQFADALFGISVAEFAYRIWRWRWIWRPISDENPWVRVATSAGLKRLHTLVTVGQRLARPTDHPEGFASGFAMYTDLPIVTKILGAELVAQRVQARLAYVEGRLASTVRRPGTLADHLEVGHFVNFFCDDALSLWRQAAQARGKTLYAPFTSRRLVETVLRIPSPDRYLRGRRFKHLLKDLLARRLPTYPVDQRKGSSGLPFARFWSKGPLRGAAERYPKPDFLEPQLWKRIIDEPGWLAWNVFTLALWQQRVLRRGAALPPPAVRVFEA